MPRTIAALLALVTVNAVAPLVSAMEDEPVEYEFRTNPELYAYVLVRADVVCAEVSPQKLPPVAIRNCTEVS